MGYFCPKINLSKKYIPSAKTLYTEDLTFNYLCENSPNYLCHYIIFLDTTPLYFFSSNTTYSLQKQPIRVQIFRLSAARVKVHLIPHVIFKQKVSFSSNSASLFSVMRHNNSSVLFHLYALDKRSPSKCKFSDF